MHVGQREAFYGSTNVGQEDLFKIVIYFTMLQKALGKMQKMKADSVTGLCIEG